MPAGLGKLPPELAELVDFYELDCDLLAAANEQSPKLPAQSAREPDIDDWLDNQTPETLRELMRRVLQDDAAAVRAESLAAMRNQSGKATWPTGGGFRTLEELQELARAKVVRRKKREQASEQRKLEKRVATMREDPASAIADAQRQLLRFSHIPIDGSWSLTRYNCEFGCTSRQLGESTHQQVKRQRD